MLNSTKIAQSLLAAGFSVPSSHPLVSVDGSLKDPRQEGFEVFHGGGGCMSLYREYGRFYMQISIESGDGFDLDEWQNNFIAVGNLETDDELVSVSAEEWQEVIAAVATPPIEQEDDWIDFTHNGKRWSFDSDHLAQWDEVEGHFEFQVFHQLTGPTVETVGRFIDQL